MEDQDMANQYTEDFKKNAVKYYKEHSELGYVKCALFFTFCLSQILFPMLLDIF